MAHAGKCSAPAAAPQSAHGRAAFSAACLAALARHTWVMCSRSLARCSSLRVFLIPLPRRPSSTAAWFFMISVKSLNEFLHFGRGLIVTAHEQHHSQFQGDMLFGLRVLTHIGSETCPSVQGVASVQILLGARFAPLQMLLAVHASSLSAGSGSSFSTSSIIWLAISYQLTSLSAAPSMSAQNED